MYLSFFKSSVSDKFVVTVMKSNGLVAGIVGSELESSLDLSSFYRYLLA